VRPSRVPGELPIETASIGGDMSERKSDAGARDAVYYLERAVPWIVFGLVGVIVVLSVVSAVLGAP